MNLINPGPPLNLQEIEAFEREIGRSLPIDYKKFLLASNGGMTKPAIGFRWSGQVLEIPGFDMLLPLGERGLRRGLSNLRELGIDGFVPIASTIDQHDICLNVVDEIGSVVLATYTYEDDNPVDATITTLADSFNGFLDNLFEIPEVFCPIENLGREGTADDLAAYLAQGGSLNAAGKNGLTLLCEAIKYANLPLVQACIERGAALTHAIHIATMNKRLELIEILVDAGADVNERDEFGDRPLSYVGGTMLPGDEGADNRRLRDVLIRLGAVR